MSVRSKMLIAVVVITLVTSLVSWFTLDWRVTKFVEEEIGFQMVVQAEIAAHLIKVGEARGMSADEINNELAGISSSVREMGRKMDRSFEYEFWITDPGGHAYLNSESKDFQFTKDQQQASEFLPLLHYDPGTQAGGGRPFVVQEARRREISNDIFKYVGVSGVDMPRIVQVGYHAAPLIDEIRWDVAGVAGLLVALVQVLCGGGLFYIAFHQVSVPVERLTEAIHDLERSNDYNRPRIDRLKSRHDEFGRFAAVFSDFATRILKEAQQLGALRAEADQNRKVFLEVDGNGTITDCNPFALQVFGFSRDELIGQHMNRIIPHEAQDEVKVALKELQSDDWTDNFNENCTKGGERLWIHWRNRMVRAGRESTRTHCFGMPMTFLVSAVEAKENLSGEVIRFAADVMARQAKQAEAVQNMQVFLSSTAHELRDPLHAIRTYTNLLLPTELTATQKYDLKIVNGQAVLLQINIGGLLDSVKIRKGILTLKRERFCVRAAVEDVVSAYSIMAVEKRLILFHRVAGDVPDQVIGDQYRFEQVLGNLMKNAIKFTEEGHVRLEITRDQPSLPGKIRLVGRVTDTGIGIPSVKWLAVFEPHEQISASGVVNADGLGLGLTICRGLVREMGGKIEVEASEVGCGTTFRFDVLCGLREDTASICEPPGPPAVNGRSAILVDPHPDRRRVLAELLREWGLVVIEAGAVEGDVTAFRKVEVDVAIIDSASGSGGEFAAVESLRSAIGSDKVPVVLLVPAAQPAADPDACARLGIRAVVHQPATRVELGPALAAMWAPVTTRVPGQLGASPARKALRVLVVDDQVLHRLGHQRMLEKHGHSVVLAENGEQALAAVQREPFDLILLDIRMKPMNGLEVATQVRGMDLLFDQPRIIALSGNTPREESEMRTWRRSGIDRCLEKPLVEERLLATILDVMDDRSEAISRESEGA